MPTFQCVTIFNQGKTGWSETWYWTGSNYDQALTNLRGLATPRKGLLGSGATIEYLRVSDVAVKGDSQVQLVQEWGTSGDPPNADQPWNAVYVRCEAGPLYRRQVWLRGLPDEWIAPAGSNPAKPELNADLAGALAKFRSALINRAFQLRVIQKDGAGGVQTPVTGITAGDGGRARIAVGTPQGNVGDTFRMSDWSGPDKKLLNGVHKIAAVGAGYVEIGTKFSDLTSPAEDVGGKAKPRIFIYVTVEDLIQIRAAKRNTGRAFFSPRGRRKVAR